MILSLPIDITVEDASKRVREVLSSDQKIKFDRDIARDKGSFIYLRTVAKALGVTLLPVKG